MFMQMAARRRRMGGFSPLGLFRSSEPGVWLDPSDLSTLFQDDAGTTPVTAAGQSVGMVRDKSGRGNHATQSIFASRPLYQVDSGGRGYLSFDGVDDFLVTPTITPGTDKVQVFAGVRKLSDTVQEMLVETSATFTSNAGSMYLLNGTGSSPGARFAAAGRGSLLAVHISSTGVFTSPITAVLTALHDIAGDLTQLRVNGAANGSATGDKGVGNFLAYPLYIGARGGTSLPFNGRLYGLITRFGPNLTADQISQIERWLNAKTGAF